MNTQIKASVVYPSYRSRGYPTPNETLWICDHCGQAEWGQHTYPVNGGCMDHLCPANRDKYGQRMRIRMRRAKAEETRTGIEKLEKTIAA